MNNYLEGLNEVQRAAVENIDGPVLVNAGAGSGKTRVLTYRIAHILNSGKNPSSVLSLTFTNKAAKEMKERIASIVGENTARNLWMGTFHSIFARILRYEAKTIGYPSTFTIYDSDDSLSLIRKIIKERNLDKDIYKPAEVYKRISRLKNNLITPSEYDSDERLQQIDKNNRVHDMSAIYRIYSARCFKAGVMDFDDLLLNTYKLFANHKDILTKYQERFQYIMVDEYQDTNFVQYKIVSSLSGRHRNICVVGDDSQSIYSFRGAQIENILNFKIDYKDLQTYNLEQNYRSTKIIVDAANSLIQKNENRLPKQVWSGNESGQKIRIINARTDREEGILVTRTIASLQQTYHFDYSDFAILYRTNFQSRIFEEALRKLNIPYKIFSGISFYQRKEIKDILAYCRLILNLADEEAFLRIINYPKRGIGNTSIEKLTSYTRSKGVPLWQVVSNIKQEAVNISSGAKNKIADFVERVNELRKKVNRVDADEIVEEIILKFEIRKDLHDKKTPELISRYENIQELVNGIKDFTERKIQENESALLNAYLEEVALLTSDDADNDEDKNRVALMTIHAAKGLEFKNVFVTGMEKGLFPSDKIENSKKAIEEERRIFYVAITRAEKNLFLSFAWSRFRFGNHTQNQPSRFLFEIEPKYIDTKDIKMLATTKPPIKNQDSGFRLKQQREFPLNKKSQDKQSKFDFSRSSKSIPLKKAEEITPDNSQSHPDNDKLQTGMKVEHSVYGTGKILRLEGSYTNRTAIVFFQNAGQKKLLLKFAKLKVL